MKGISKFDFTSFVGGYDSFAVSKQKYTKEEAIEIAKAEYFYQDDGYIGIGDGFVRHRAGVNEDGEKVVGWWGEYEEYERSCPVWMFHYSKSPKDKDYEYIELIK